MEEALRDRRRLLRYQHFELHEVRWAAVKYWKMIESCSWDAAYAAAAAELRGSPFTGGEETMRASYKNHQRSPAVAVLRKHGGVDAVNKRASEIYSFYKEKHFLKPKTAE
jgi:hypothetical protein